MAARLVLIALVLLGINFEGDRVWDHWYIFKGTWLLAYNALGINHHVIVFSVDFRARLVSF